MDPIHIYTPKRPTQQDNQAAIPPTPCELSNTTLS